MTFAFGSAPCTLPRSVKWLLPVVAFESAFAQGQNPDASIQAAFNSLRSNPSIFLHLQGSDGSHPIVSETYWTVDMSGPQPSAKVRVEGYRDGKPTSLTVGDGTSLWAYANSVNEYSVAAYGSFNGRQPDKYAESMLQSLVATSRGPTVYSDRLLRDVYAGSQAYFKSWMPGIPGVEYIDQNTHVVTYATETRKFVFWLNPTSGELTNIDYYSTDAGNSTSWRITISPYQAPQTSWNYSFTPPAGSRPLARSSSGG